MGGVFLELIIMGFNCIYSDLIDKECNKLKLKGCACVWEKCNTGLK